MSDSSADPGSLTNSPTVTPVSAESAVPVDPALVQALRSFGAGHEVFGRFRLMRELGKGGMGVVWLARDERLGIEVALKFLAGMVSADAEALLDLRKEITRGLVLTHPGIVRLYDLHEDGQGLAAIAMEYVPGSTLAEQKLGQPDRCFDPPELTTWVRELCEVLAYMHEKARVVHRDLKPRNLMLTAAGELKVTDFGIAATMSDSHSRLTNLDTSGTPAYMSPQQAGGYRPMASDDIYAVGATLYELLTGKPPFFRGTGSSILHQLINHQPPTLTERRAELGIEGRPPLPAAWESTIAACLAKEAEDRPASIRVVAERLLGSEDIPRETVTAVAEEIAAEEAVTEMPEAQMVSRAEEAPEIAGRIPEPFSPPAAIVPPPRPRPRRRPLLMALTVLALAAGAGWSVVHFQWLHPAPVAAEPPKGPFLRLEVGMHTAGITDLALDRRGTMLLTTSRDKTARLWNLSSNGKLMQVLRPPLGMGREGTLFAGALSPDGSQAAVGGVVGVQWDTTSRIYIFDTASGRLVRNITDLPRGTTELVYSPDGRFLAAGLNGAGGLRLYENATGKLCGQDEGYTETIHDVQFNPAGTQIATSGADSMLRLYAVDGAAVAPENRLKQLSSLKTGQVPFRIRFSPKGEQLAVGGEGVSPVSIHAVPDLKQLFTPEPEKKRALRRFRKAVAWSADGQTLYASGRARLFTGEIAIALWDQAGRGETRNIAVGGSAVSNLLSLPGGGVVYCTLGPSWGVLDPKGEVQPLGKSPNLDFRPESVNLYVSADAGVVAFSFLEREGKAARFSVSERKLTVAAAGDNPALDPRLHATKRDGIANLPKKMTLSDTNQVVEAEGRMRALAVSADASFFVSGGDGDLNSAFADGKYRWSRTTLTNVTGLNLSSNNQIAVASHGDGRLCWYRATDGRLLLTLYVHADSQRWVAWTPEGFYDCSSRGEELFGWQQNQGKDREGQFFSAARFHDTYYRPDIVARALEAPPSTPEPDLP